MRWPKKIVVVVMRESIDDDPEFVVAADPKRALAYFDTDARTYVLQPKRAPRRGRKGRKK